MATRRSYNSIAGTDIKAVIGPHIVGSIQAISYSIVREKIPVFTMGKVGPRGFARGKRAIAGSLIFIMFDMHPILFSLSEGDGANVKSVAKFIGDDGDLQLENSTDLSFTEVNTPNFGDQRPMPVNYVDQIPPFDTTLTGTTEMGIQAQMGIIGMELLNEAGGMSIDDVVAETQYTYVAVDVSPWHRIDSKSGATTMAGKSII